MTLPTHQPGPMMTCPDARARQPRKGRFAAAIALAVAGVMSVAPAADAAMERPAGAPGTGAAAQAPSKAPAKIYPAMAGMSVENVVALAQTLPTTTTAPDVPRCDARAALDTAMQDEFAEAPVARISGAMRLFGSAEAGTFTVVLDRDSGSSCVVASGTGYGDERREQIVASLQPLAQRIALR